MKHMNWIFISGISLLSSFGVALRYLEVKMIILVRPLISFTVLNKPQFKPAVFLLACPLQTQFEQQTIFVWGDHIKDILSHII